MAVTMKSSLFGVVTPCSLERVGHFRGIYCLHLQGQRESQARNQKLVTCFCWFLALLLDLRDGGDMFL
jgi:hypothetical protein